MNTAKPFLIVIIVLGSVFTIFVFSGRWFNISMEEIIIYYLFKHDNCKQILDNPVVNKNGVEVK